MKLILTLSITLAAASLAVIVGPPALAEPPPPPGGHVPVFFGGANQGAYPPLPGAVEEELAASGTPSLSHVSSAPNPFRGATTIQFNLRLGEEARLLVFDLTGRLLHERRHRAVEEGLQAMVWDGRGEDGTKLPSGIYFYQVQSEKRSVTKKLVFLR